MDARIKIEHEAFNSTVVTGYAKYKTTQRS